ncbi:DNA gyrase inhibitor YacG [Azospirillum sp. B506]|uniref:DNA gyrase inhibitor YacG n=1 Tax=Azospirillum sp. B506 TaxID=137721 RepID=UPI001FCA9E99|nr:DNA gyrase inhibitor YacG [Azospirillum sp. B506]
MCGRPTEPATRPFCSKRCADIDLSRWLGGVYRIEGPESPATPGGSDADERS